MDQFHIAIIGLGYVGLPLAHAFSQRYPVIGIDIDVTRVNELCRLHDRTCELSKEKLQECLDRGVLFSTDIADASHANVYIITVPTPIDATNRPDLTPLINASKAVATVLKKDDIVIYESTVYPGVTEEVCVNILEQESGLQFNLDFFAGYSPERINPGDKKHTITTIKKLTSGSTPQTAKTVDALYRSIIQAGTHLCSCIRVAEAAKVIENTQRDVNIALINELAIIFDTMGIDTKEVLDAAATKWNFIKFTPGLVGGHCIGVDPYYLTFKAQELGYKPNLILNARQINDGMGKFIAERTVKEMIARDKKIKDGRVLVLGLTFKENCPDIRNSKVFDIIDELCDYGCDIDAYDPWIDPSHLPLQRNFTFIDTLDHTTDRYDAIIVAVAHNTFQEIPRSYFDIMSRGEPIIIDVKGIIERPTWRL